MSLPITCVVADDHPAVLESVCRRLERDGIRVVGRARDGEEALAHVEAQRPAVAVLDLRMPRLGGLAVARRISRSTPQCAPLVYTGYAEKPLLVEALDAGARGYVLKDAPLSGLARAIETVAEGRQYIDPALADVLLRAAPEGDARLTAQERDVLRLLADGHSNETIGRELYISPDTARTKLAAAMAKLGAATRTEAVAIAIRRELIA